MEIVVALIVMVALYGGIWWAISRIKVTPPTFEVPAPLPPTPPVVAPSHPARSHMRMQQSDRLRIDLHTDEEFTL